MYDRNGSSSRPQSSATILQKARLQKAKAHGKLTVNGSMFSEKSSKLQRQGKQHALDGRLVL